MAGSRSSDSLLARTARGAGWVVAWRLGVRILGLGSTLILVRLIQPADFGIIALATGFVQTLDGMLILGTEEAIIREPQPGRTFYDTAFTLNLLRGIVVTAIVAALAYPAARFFADPRLGPVLFCVACLPLLDGVSNIGAVEFRRDFAFQKEFAVMVVPKLFGILSAITAAAVTHSYVALLCGMGVNRGLRSAMSYAMHPYRPTLSLRAWRGLGGYSLWSLLLGLAGVLRDRIDSLLLGRLMNTAAVGWYAVGAEIAALPMTELVEPLGRAAFSGFAAARVSQADPRQTFLRLVGFAALLTLPAGVGLSLVAAPLVAFGFGAEWTQAVPVLRILALSSTVMVFGHLSLHLLSAHALLRRLTGITLIGAATRLVLMTLLISRFGLTGAAIGASIAVVLEQVATFATAVNRLGIGHGAIVAQIWRPVLATGVMAAVLAVGGVGWSDNVSLPGLFEALGAGAVIYPLALSGLWWIAGRPRGAEADILALLRRAVR